MPHRTQQVRALSLRELLPDAEFFGSDDIRVRSCCGNAKRCRPGDLFVALASEIPRALDLARLAIERGAGALLADCPLPDLSLPVCYVPDARKAYGRVCHALAGDPSNEVKVLGVAGAHGAATVSWLLTGIFAHAGHATGLIGSLGCFDGSGWHAPHGPLPQIPRLARALADIRDRGCSHAVVEASRGALRNDRFEGIEFDSACIPWCWGRGRGANRRADRRTADRFLERLGPHGLAVLNADDRLSATLVARHAGPVLTVGLRQGDVTASMVEQHASEQTFLLCAGQEVRPIRTTLVGTDNVYHCLMAAAIGLSYELSLDEIVRGLENVTCVPGVCERVECGQPFGLFVDRSRSAAGVARRLRTLRETAAGRVLCVFGADGDSDARQRAGLGRAVERAADLSIVTTDNPRHASAECIAVDVIGGMRDATRARVILDRAAAIRWALAEARPGDCVLLAGKGDAAYQIVGDEWLPNDDRKIAADWLYHADAGRRVSA